MRNWKPPRPLGWLARTALPGLRAVHDQVETYAAHWEESNQLVLTEVDRKSPPDPTRHPPTEALERAPLWVALGDSTAQGVGAPDPSRGYVGQLGSWLARRSGKRWSVLNLSRSGARVVDVLEVQIPRLEALVAPPRLVTCAVGANDLVRRTEVPLLTDQLRRLMDRLPTGSVFATLPQGLRPVVASSLNDLIKAEASAQGLVVADVWATTAPPWTGKLAPDGFHPGTLGYADWSRAFELALDGVDLST